VDNAHHQHELPLRPPGARLLAQGVQIPLPARGPLHRHLPGLWARRARRARHPQEAHPVPAAGDAQGLQQRPALLRLLVEADALQPGGVRAGGAAGQRHAGAAEHGRADGAGAGSGRDGGQGREGVCSEPCVRVQSVEEIALSEGLDPRELRLHHPALHARR
ncbi:hypothetical protein LTR16_010844, partial [Cryomyces antarcticus]